MFHAYYQHLKVVIESFPCMIPHTLDKYRQVAKFQADPHFLYIIVCRDENQEDLHSYYKLTNEYMDQITKEWPEEFLVPIADAELFDTDTIGSPIVNRVEHVRQSSGMKKKKKQEEFQDIETDEGDISSEDNRSDSP
jgi:hypothetical protein